MSQMREEDSGIQGYPLLPKSGKSDTPTRQQMLTGQGNQGGQYDGAGNWGGRLIFEKGY